MVHIPQEVKDLEKAGVRQAEEGDLSGALEQLTRVLELVPNYASGYNNRAQVSTHYTVMLHFQFSFVLGKSAA